MKSVIWKEHGYTADFKNGIFINKGLWGTSIGGKETLKIWTNAAQSAYPSQVVKTGEETISIGFEKEIVSVNGKLEDKSTLSTCWRILPTNTV